MGFWRGKMDARFAEAMLVDGAYQQGYAKGLEHGKASPLDDINRERHRRGLIPLVRQSESHRQESYGKSAAERGMEKLGYRWSDLDGRYIDTLSPSKETKMQNAFWRLENLDGTFRRDLLTEAAAREAAEINARANPGKTYRVLKCIGHAIVASPAIWTDYEQKVWFLRLSGLARRFCSERGCVIRDLESRIRAVVRRRTPKGVKLIERAGARNHGMTDGREIVCEPIVDRDTLAFFLHEVAHVVLGHCADPTVPHWLAEYEADQWAFKAMRAEGVAVSERYRGLSRHSVRCYVEKAQAGDPDIDIEDEVLRFCFPDSWKNAA